MKFLIPILTAAFLATGCASVPSSELAASHPANAQAAQGTFPLPVPTLMSVTNLMVQKPVTAAAPEHPHGHEAHEAKPKPEASK